MIHKHHEGPLKRSDVAESSSQCACTQVRDGRVTVTRAEDGRGYTVTALDKASMEERKKGKERSQCIISLDMHDWEDYCTRVHPDSCLMSHRPPPASPEPPALPTQVQHASHAYAILVNTTDPARGSSDCASQAPDVLGCLMQT